MKTHQPAYWLWTFLLVLGVSSLVYEQGQGRQTARSGATAVNFLSPFAYSVNQEVTAFHLVRLMKRAEEAGVTFTFLNVTEYGNIVHALAIKTAQFLSQGDVLMSVAAMSQTHFSALQSTRQIPLFFALFENIWTVLEMKIGHGSAEKPFIYIRDVGGEPSNQSLTSMALGVKTIDNQGFGINFRFPQDPLLFLFPTITLPSMQPSSLSYYSSLSSDLLALDVDHNLWISFESILSRISETNREPDQNIQVVLYLKDLSRDQNRVLSLEDADRINIGVLFEDSNGNRYDLDWIVEDQLVLYNPPVIGDREHILTAFHESAHELVRQALRGNNTEPRFLSINSGLLIFLLEYEFFPTHGQHIHNELSQSQSKRAYVHSIAEHLAGFIAERKLSTSPQSHFVDLNVNDRRYDMQNAWKETHKGICLHLSYNEDECLIARSMEGWVEWVNQLDPSEKETFEQERREWIFGANILAGDVLTLHANVWTYLTRLLLQRGRLDTQDLESFYMDHALVFPNNLSRLGFTNLSPSEAQALDQMGGRYAPVHTPTNVSLQEALVAFGSTDLLEGIEMDAHYRNLALGFALDPSQNLERVQGLSMEEVFDQIKSVDVPENLQPFIRKNPPIENLQPPYPEGLPALYFEYLHSRDIL